MGSIVLILCIIPVAALVWAIAAYNRLIRQRNRLKEGWSGIDVQLKRRHDLIPGLVETVKAYQQHEESLLEAVTKHRAEAAAANSVSDASGAEKTLGGDLRQILMLAEAYPDLKSDEQFHKLGTNLVDIEDNLQYARRYYNGCVRDLNNLVESFPSSVLAKAFGFQSGDFFELDSAAAELSPDLSKLLSKNQSE